MIPVGREPRPADITGSAEYAAELTESRDQRVHDALQWLTYAHLPEALRKFSAPFFATAVDLIVDIRADSDELIIALHKLTEAKDAAMRAGIRHQTGRAGSVPRPQQITAPPKLSD